MLHQNRAISTSISTPGPARKVRSPPPVHEPQVVHADVEEWLVDAGRPPTAAEKLVERALPRRGMGTCGVGHDTVGVEHHGLEPIEVERRGVNGHGTSSLAPPDH